MKHTVNEIEQYDSESYKVLENKIIPRKKKRKTLIQLNLVAILIWIIFSIVTVFIIKPQGNVIFDITIVFDILLVILSFIIYIVVHELLHAIGFVLFDPNIKKNDITFGLSLKSGVAYCIAKKPVTVKAARWSLMMPVYVICIPLYIIAFVNSNLILALIAVYFFIGSVGDFYYLYLLRNSNKHYYMKEDLPTSSGYEIGYILYEKVTNNS